MFDKFSRQIPRPQGDRWSGRLVKLPDEVEQNLTSDLEWMVNSRQVSDEVVVEAIMGDYGPWLYWLASTLLDDPIQINKALIKVIEDLLSKRRRLWSGDEVQIWMFKHTIQISRKLQNRVAKNSHLNKKDSFQEKGSLEELEAFYKLPLILRYPLGLSERHTANILEVELEEVRHRIGVVVGYLSKYSTFPSHDTQANRDEWIEKTLLKSWDFPELSRSEAKAIGTGVLSRVGKNASIRNLFGRGLQVGFGILVVVFAFAIVWLTNVLTPPAEMMPPIIETVLVTRVVEVSNYVTATPVPTSEVTSAGTGPLSVKSSPEEIRQRIKNSRGRWDTLWMDGRIIDYGPIGYVGRPKTRREQIWIDQPNNSLVLSGWAGERVDQIWFSVNGKVYEVHPKTGHPVLYDFHTNQLPVYSSFSNYLFPETLYNELIEFGFRVVGSGQVAGRRAVIVERREADSNAIVRYWVDNYTGIILRMMQYGMDGASVLFEIVVRDISLDVEFPNQIFDRNKLPLNFGADHYGQPFPIRETLPSDITAQYLGHIPKPRITPQPGYDPSRSQLTFQWEHQPPTGALQNFSRWMRYPDNFGEDVPVDLFADQYYLGQMTINPWHSTCDRSADGTIIALHSVTGEDDNPVTTLRWLDLRDSSSVHELKSQGNQANLAVALSPDGSMLAFYACMENGGGDNCGVFILDTTNGSYQKLAAVQWVEGFLWSSQGESIVVNSSSIVQVFNVGSGGVTYSMDASLHDQRVPESFPITDGGEGFANATPGLEACYQAPSKSK